MNFIGGYFLGFSALFFVFLFNLLITYRLFPIKYFSLIIVCNLFNALHSKIDSLPEIFQATFGQNSCRRWCNDDNIVNSSVVNSSDSVDKEHDSKCREFSVSNNEAGSCSSCMSAVPCILHFDSLSGKLNFFILVASFS